MDGKEQKDIQRRSRVQKPVDSERRTRMRKKSGAKNMDGRNERDRRGGRNERERRSDQTVRRETQPIRSLGGGGLGTKRRRRGGGKVILAGIVAVAIFLILALCFMMWKRYGMTKDHADLSDYFGSGTSGGIGVVIDHEVVKSSTGFPAGRRYGHTDYIEYTVLSGYIDQRFYWDDNEQVLLYTLPTGSVVVHAGTLEYTALEEKKSEECEIVRVEGTTVYVALAFVEKYADMQAKRYDSPDRLVVRTKWEPESVATAGKNTQVRYQGGVKSPVLTDVEAGAPLTVLEDEGDWKKVATDDGFVGYVPSSVLADVREVTEEHSFDAPVYTRKQENGLVNLAWHNVENPDANSHLTDVIAPAKGVTVVAPTWFSIADTKGNIQSIGDEEYVRKAHEANLKVWAVFRDFHGGINSYDETTRVLSYTSRRQTMLDQLMEQAKELGVDGINLDFELVNSECGPHYIQFVRELSARCREQGLVLSVDNYTPQPYNTQYDLKEQGKVVDYVVLMAYDEYTAGSEKPGPVSSYSFVESGVVKAIESVPADRLIVGIPFYTRVWTLTSKTGQSVAGETESTDGTYPYHVESAAVGIRDVPEILEKAQKTGTLQHLHDDISGGELIQWEADGAIKQMWPENLDTIEAKLKLIPAHGLAGVAEWKLGFETEDVWPLIQEYVK